MRTAAVAAEVRRGLAGDFAIVERLVGEARGAGVSLLALPEACLGGYLSHLEGGADDPPALDPDGPEIRRLARLAGDLVVCAGDCEDARDRRDKNAGGGGGGGGPGPHPQSGPPPRAQRSVAG